MVSLPSLEQLRALGPLQQPTYPDPTAVDAAVARLRTAPPLVFAGECDDLRSKIAAVSRGEAFLLQGGDCAETFDGVTADNVRNKLRVLLQMAVVDLCRLDAGGQARSTRRPVRQAAQQ